jgi:hypothetical protein
MTKVKPKDKPHYVNNALFSQSVVDYVRSVREAREKDLPTPIVTNYIAECFLKISEGLSHKGNFVRYTYREEMVMDAVENCLKAIENYDIDKATRTGNPNAFAYFTQISWYAFLRRIEKEKKQQEIRLKYISESGIENMVSQEEYDNDDAIRATQFFVDELRLRIDSVKDTDRSIKEFQKESRKRRRRRVDSDLSDFLEEEAYDE